MKSLHLPGMRQQLLVGLLSIGDIAVVDDNPLYRRVLEPLGYDYTIDLSRCDQAACSLVVRRARLFSSAGISYTVRPE